jgi:hypothetical protein
VDFQAGLSGTITLTAGEPVIDRDLTIAGPGSSVIRVSGNHASRVFDIPATFTVSISGLTIADGFTTANGGGIFNTGTLAVTDSTLSGNSADIGGGIFTRAMSQLATVTNSIFSDNSARGAGGGIYNVVGRVAVTDTTLCGNSASGTTGIAGGGGMYNNDGIATVTSSTLIGNSASGSGGGIYNAVQISNLDILTVTDSTISGNSAGGAGSGIYNAGIFAVRGLVTIDGDYFQTATGTLDVRIGGLQAGIDYDQLVVNGFATLNGTLRISLVNGYQPQPGDQFQPLVFAQGQGTFAHYAGDVGGFSFLYVYEDGDFLPPGLTLVAN